MKKIIKRLLVVCSLLVSLLLTNTYVYAASVTFTGPTVVRAGDTIQLNIVIAEAGRNAIEGVFAYDSNQVSLTSVTTSMAGWKVETNGNVMTAYDENMTNPTKGNNAVVTATFVVKGNVATGTTVKIALNNIALNDVNNMSYDIGTVSYSVTIAKPLSNVNTLSNLSVAGCTLSPAFNSSTTTYSVGEVDFDVTTLNVTATPTEGTAKVSVSGNNLAVGNNTVTVTVTAENGSAKYYQINVVRKQDPNYVASSDASVSQLTINKGQISPSFSADVTDYVVYVPYESVGSSFEVTGTAADYKATGIQSGVIEALAVGVNKTVLVCTAEDGSTKEYNVTVVVMPEYNGEIPEIGDIEVDEPTTEAPSEEETSAEIESEDNEEETTTQIEETESEQGKNKEQNTSGVPAWLVAVITVCGMGVGFASCYIFLRKKINA